jgi:anti-anti-sigma regulatory factor
MEFRRIDSLPPYVFTIIDTLKIEARRAGGEATLVALPGRVREVFETVGFDRVFRIYGALPDAVSYVQTND